MTQNEKNPKVYPVVNQGNVYESGMTLRDHFAGLAMQGFVSDREMYLSMMHDRTNGVSADDYVAMQSYNLADAMLKQREL